MLEDCLKGDSLMGVVLIKKGNPKSLLDAPTYSVAGLGRITRVMKLPDSSFSVLLGGIARNGIKRYTQRRPYLVAEIERLETCSSDPRALDQLRIRILELFRALSRAEGTGEAELITHLEKLKDSEVTSNLVAAALSVDAHIKQKLLETLDLRERLGKLIRVMELHLEHAVIWQKILAGAPKNINDN
jgi:ATP-dependent Lon protease